MNMNHIQNIAHIIRTAGKHAVFLVRNIPVFCKRMLVKISIYTEKGFLKDALSDVDALTAESQARHNRLGRQDFNKVLTMEIDSRMVLAMDEVKKFQKSIEEKEEKLSHLSYK